MARRLVSSVTFLGQILKLTYVSRPLSTILFVMTSGDLNIDLTQKSALQKLYVFQGAIKRHLLFVATIRGFRYLTGGAKRPPPYSEPFRARLE